MSLFRVGLVLLDALSKAVISDFDSDVVIFELLLG
jgi:hypothetical protein